MEAVMPFSSTNAPRGPSSSRALSSSSCTFSRYGKASGVTSTSPLRRISKPWLPKYTTSASPTRSSASSVFRPLMPATRRYLSLNCPTSSLSSGDTSDTSGVGTIGASVPSMSVKTATVSGASRQASSCPRISSSTITLAGYPPTLPRSSWTVPSTRPPPAARARSAVDAVVPEAEAPDVREVSYAVRVVADRDSVQQLPAVGVNHGYRAVVTVGVPELGAIGRELEHVGAAADLPGVGYLAGRKVYDRDGPRAAVGDVQRLGVPGGIQAVCPFTRWDELDHFHGLRVDDVHAAEGSPLVGDVEDRSVGRELYVYRVSAYFYLTRDLHLLYIHLRHHPAPFAAGEQVAAVGGEVHVVHARGRDVNAAHRSPRIGIAEL